jgi:hypothetical protein
MAQRRFEGKFDGAVVGYDAVGIAQAQAAILQRLGPPRNQGTAAKLFQGVVTRTGLFEYPNGIVELRTPDMLLSWDAFDTYLGIPLLMGPAHPPESEPEKPPAERERIFDREATEAATIGSLLKVVPMYDWDDEIGEDLLAGQFTVTRQDGRDAIEKGTQGYLSLGYLSFHVKEQGEWKGRKYTHRTVALIPDHLIITPTPRAGAVALIRADSQRSRTQHVVPAVPRADKKEKPMAERKLKIGPFEYDLDEAAALAIVKEREEAQARADALVKERDLSAARADSLVKERDAEAGKAVGLGLELAQAKKDLDAAKTEATAKADSLVKERDEALARAKAEATAQGDADGALLDLLVSQGKKPSEAAKLLRADKAAAVKVLADSLGVELPSNPTPEFLQGVFVAASKLGAQAAAKGDEKPAATPALGVGRALGDAAPAPGAQSPTPPAKAAEPKPFSFADFQKS